MSVFGKYSSYYNLLYKDKDYAGEAGYVHNLIQKYCPGAKSILDLGCGTGRHDLLLAEKGYSVVGVDQSEEMLAIANSQLLTKTETKIEIENKCSTSTFIQGDVRNVRLNKTFDVVTSLFHVMSYQITNEDLNAAFETAKVHLKKGGVFIFDCWYGPAVLTDRPAVRVKRLEDEDIFVTRIAEPVMHPNENVVDVNYHVFIKNRANNAVEELREVHSMRYLFSPEIELFLSQQRLRLLASFEWMSEREPGVDTWGVCFVVRG